jgi:hypothetical protein
MTREEFIKEVSNNLREVFSRKRRTTLREIKEHLKENLTVELQDNAIKELIEELCVNCCKPKNLELIIAAELKVFAINNRSLTDDATFETYEPKIHGVWKLDASSKKPFLKDLPNMVAYLKWLKELYGREWESVRGEVLRYIASLGEEIRRFVKQKKFR